MLEMKGRGNRGKVETGYSSCLFFLDTSQEKVIN